jgi:hypothetical protein
MKIKLFLREIRVVPVVIEADSVEQAQELIREGDGEYLNDQSYPSSLSVDDLLDNIFEEDAEIINEITYNAGDPVTVKSFGTEFTGTVIGYRDNLIDVRDFEGCVHTCMPNWIEKGWI